MEGTEIINLELMSDLIGKRVSILKSKIKQPYKIKRINFPRLNIYLYPNFPADDGIMMFYIYEGRIIYARYKKLIGPDEYEDIKAELFNFIYTFTNIGFSENKTDEIRTQLVNKNVETIINYDKEIGSFGAIIVCSSIIDAKLEGIVLSLYPDD